jgi:hypothetical protein
MKPELNAPISISDKWELPWTYPLLYSKDNIQNE